MRDWSMDIARGEILGLAGRSGCGKTVLCSAIMGIIDPPGRVVSGSVRFTSAKTGEVSLTSLSEKEWRRIRGSAIGMVFQDPYAAFSPAHTVARHFRCVMGADARGATGRAALQEAEALLDRLGFPCPRHVLSAYPHELSGGMAQRVSIALALVRGPALLIADEPAAALDRVNGNRIMTLFSRVREEFGTGILLVSHDWTLLRGIADRIAVMPNQLAISN
jgi:peptide/nickel transport system ATP-binding protein